MTPKPRAAGGKPARKTTAAAAARPAGATDAAVLAAALEVCQCLDLADQLRAFCKPAVAWSGATGGLVFSVDEDGDGFAVTEGTLPAEDPLRTALSAAPPSRRDPWTRSIARFGGLGPFEASAPATLPRRPSVSAIVPLRASADEDPLAFVLLLDPATEGIDRVVRLEELSRAAFANALRVQAIRDLTIRDDTAECFNRRYFEEFVVEEMARANRFKAPLSLIFFDMDNLKEVNSTLGHAMGSRTIREVSQRVRAKIRKFDKLFRFGGDEFCIVLPETEWHGALEVAERVRDAIASRPFLVRERGEGGGRPMTASFGVASYPLHARTKEDLVIRADRAMQTVKGSTKNAIAVAEQAPRGDLGR